MSARRIDKLLEKLPFGPKGTGKKKGGGLSRFRFPGQKQQDAGSSSGGPAQKGAKQPVAQASSSLPRNKQANNKKNKERKKGARAAARCANPVITALGGSLDG